MRRMLIGLVALLACSSAAHAQGLLVPTDTKVLPLAMASHDVKVALEDQVAVTTVEQVFRNHTDRELEATYVFPVPKGASVRAFSMWVNGKEEKGELVEAEKARQIYNDIVRRTQDPGLLEYVGTNLLRVRVYPVPPHGDQKISISFTSVAPMDAGVVDYVYPLHKGRRADKFSLQVQLKSQHPIQGIYSPTHNISTTRKSDKDALVVFEKEQAFLDRDFHLYYASAAKDVGLTSLLHRPSAEAGYFLMLISPRAELSKSQEVPRDMVFVLDTSGSMRGPRIEQARKALKFCLEQLGDKDRFAVMHFATTVTKYAENLRDATPANRTDARKWVDALEANGGTAINEALLAALEMRSNDTSRPFTTVFFTDGQPTVGEVEPTRILNNVMAKNTGNTRIFTFGVGDDVNAALLDQLADKTRAVATYVREAENIEAKVSGLYAKISNPVLTDLKLAVSDSVKLAEVYPPQLPDLFHGTQLVVLGRYQGEGKAQVKLTGNVGKEAQEFVYDVTFVDKTTEEKSFVEDLWARRKVGFMLDQIRINGESKELVSEVVVLAKRYGITTPYTSYLVVPEMPIAPAVPNVRIDPGLPPQPGNPILKGPDPAKGGAGGIGKAGGKKGGDAKGGGGTGGGGTIKDAKKADKDITKTDPGGGGGFGTDPKTAGDGQAKGGTTGTGTILPPPLTTNDKGEKKADLDKLKGIGYIGGKAASPPGKVEDFAKKIGGDIEQARRAEQHAKEAKDLAEKNAKQDEAGLLRSTLDRAQAALKQNQLSTVQQGTLGVDLSVQVNNLRNQSQLAPNAVQRVASRNLVEVGGVWIDDRYDGKAKSVTIKAQSEAYFRLLERQPSLRDLLRLGNHLVYVTPSGDALIIDANHGVETLPDAEIDRLFVAPKK